MVGRSKYIYVILRALVRWQYPRTENIVIRHPACAVQRGKLTTGDKIEIAVLLMGFSIERLSELGWIPRYRRTGDEPTRHARYQVVSVSVRQVTRFETCEL